MHSLRATFKTFKIALRMSLLHKQREADYGQAAHMSNHWRVIKI